MSNKFNSVKDSGKRQEFNTGSKRDTCDNKPAYVLMSPIALDRLGMHFRNGAVKYGERNWELGQPISRYLDSALRHIMNYLEGKRDEDHLAAGMWNLHCAIHTEEMIDRGNLSKELNDLPNYLGNYKG